MSRLVDGSNYGALGLPGTWSFGCLLKMRAITAASASPVSDADAIVMDSLAKWGLHASSAGGNKLYIHQDDAVSVGTPAVRTSAAGAENTGVNPSVTLTPTVGDLFVVFCETQGNTNTSPTCTDDNGGTYTLIGTATANTNGVLSAFVRNAAVPNTTSTTVTISIGANSAAQAVVVAVSGMSRAGASAIRSFGKQDSASSGTTPAPSLSISALATNVTLGAVGQYGSAAPFVTEPTGWIEQQDVSEPPLTFGSATGLEIVSRDSGFTGTTITWGSTVGQIFASFVVELDGSLAPSPKSVSVPVTLDKWTFFHATFDGSQLRAGADGTWQTPTACGNISTAIGALLVGYNADATKKHFDGEMLGGFLEADVVLSDLTFTSILSELRDAFALPAQIGPAAYSLSCATGTFAESGVAATLRVTMPATQASYTDTSNAATLAVAMPAAQGAYVENGQVASLTKQSKIVAAQASFVETGEDAVLRVTMPATQSSFLETGQAATLTKQSRMSAAQASFSETGQSATLAVAMPAAFGSFAETGIAAGLTKQSKIAAAMGAFVETAIAATLAVTMSATAASYAETGEDAAFRVTMPAAGATYAETGNAANLLAARRLACAQASFLETGEDVILAVTLPVAAGAFSESGIAASFVVARRLTAAFGSFVESGIDAQLRAARLLTATQVTFSETGIAAALRVTMPATIASFVETGEDATLRVSMPAVLASFAETGFSVGLTKTSRLVANAGLFAESGIAGTFAVLMPAATGIFAETGEDANLIFTQPGNTTMPAGRGSFVETGFATALRASRIFAVANASFAETGQAATFSLTMPAAPASFVETGEAATFATSMPVSVGAFVSQGINAGLVRGRSFAVDPGQFTLSGEAVSFSGSRAMSAQRGLFTWTGEASALVGPTRLLASQAAFVVIGVNAQLVHGFPPTLGSTQILIASMPSTRITFADRPATRITFEAHRATSISISDTAATAIAIEAAPFTRITIMPDLKNYDVGEKVKLKIKFDVSEDPTAPDLKTPGTLEIDVKPETEDAFTLVYPSSSFTLLGDGFIELAVPLTSAGRWQFFVRSGDPAQGAEPYQINVRAKPF